MKKYRIILLITFTLLLCACNNTQEYKVGDEITLKGTISIDETIEDGQTSKISTLNLDEPIIIDGTSIKKIELSYDKSLKEGSEVEIKGTVESNSESTGISYALEVIDIDNLLSYVNTYSNDDFTMTIPKEIVKISTVKEITDGFIIYSSSDMEEENEVFRIISVTRDYFNTLTQSNTNSIEKITSDSEKVIAIIYSTNSSEEYTSEYEQIVNQINNIKDSIKIK